MSSIPQIIDVYPAPGAQGVVIGDRVTVTFDQAMDEESINTGTMVLIGPSDSFIFGPDFTPLDAPGIEDEQILNSPYTGAYVEGIITFERLNPSSGNIIDIDDFTGAGNLYRTKAIFTPNQPLNPGVEYRLLLAGDEDPTDSFDTGVRTRTVFDTVVAATGSGRLSFNGGYDGSTDAEYTIEITVGGSTGQAEYVWWSALDPLTTYPGITSTGRRLLENGVWTSCDPDGSFTVGDTFSVVCKPSEVLQDNYSWTFHTGSGSILTPPSSSSTTGISDIGGTGTTIAFGVSSIDPALREYNIDITQNTIVITFSEPPTIATVIADNFSVVAEAVSGNPIYNAVGDVTFTLSQADAVITLTLDVDQLNKNNIVKIQISDVKNADGDTITAYSSYFTTTYVPTYTSIRRIRLDLGPIIASVPNDTIMLAILEASTHVNAISFVSAIGTSLAYLNHAKRELATCLAELILVQGYQGLGLGDKLNKTLGDLTVGRSGRDILVGNKETELRECIARWEPVVQTGGEITPDTSLKPVSAVKGSTAEDAVGVGREWEPTSVPGSGMPISNQQEQATARRWVRNYRRRT